MRTGIIAKKIGMTRLFDKAVGREVPVTVLKIDNLRVVCQRTLEKDGYCAVQLGTGKRKSKNLSSGQKGYFKASNTTPCSKLVEFRVTPDNMIDVGAKIAVSHFVEKQHVDICGLSIGKGFAGAMKRHNFGGLRASHGVSISHRAHGSTGQCQDPGKVFKGKKMAGHMGYRRTTVQNLEVVKIDEEFNIIMIKGAVPGSKGGWVTVSDAVKKRDIKGAPLPAGLITEASVDSEKVEAV